jgi:hypothetical protein
MWWHLKIVILIPLLNIDLSFGDKHYTLALVCRQKRKLIREQKLDHICLTLPSPQAAYCVLRLVIPDCSIVLQSLSNQFHREL